MRSIENRRGIFACLMAILISWGYSFWFLRDRAPAPHPPSATVAPRDNPEAKHRETDNHHETTAAMVEAAPKTRFDQLAALSDSGDAIAACRLALDLNLCANAGQLRKLQEFWVEVGARAANDPVKSSEALRRASEAARNAERVVTVCKGFTPEHASQFSRRLLQTAKAGNTAAMARFALAPGFGENLTFDDADMIVAYRAHALRMLERAAVAGEPSALLGLFRAHSRGYIETPQGRMSIAKDPEQAMAVGLALQRSVDRYTQREISRALADLESEVGTLDRGRILDLQSTYEKAIAMNGPLDLSSNLTVTFQDLKCDD